MSPATEQGAYDFVKAYFAERDRTAVTGDATKLVPFRESTCSCVGVEERLASETVNGRRVVSSQLSINKWYFEWRGPTAAKAGLRISAVTHFANDGDGPQVLKETGLIFLDLKRDFSRWSLTGFRIKATP